MNVEFKNGQHDVIIDDFQALCRHLKFDIGDFDFFIENESQFIQETFKNSSSTNTEDEFLYKEFTSYNGPCLVAINLCNEISYDPENKNIYFIADEDKNFYAYYSLA